MTLAERCNAISSLIQEVDEKWRFEHGEGILVCATPHPQDNCSLIVEAKQEGEVIASGILFSDDDYDSPAPTFLESI